MVKVAPSILSADFLHLGAEVQKAEDARADYLHFDVMDGRFVPNITFGQAVLRAVAQRTSLPCDVHLMIEEPERYIEDFASAGARIITIHAEATRHIHRTLTRIRELGCSAGISLNPATSPDCLRYSLGYFDQVLVMTVNPGFGGQKLIPQTLHKIREVRDMLTAAGVQADIEVDGGVNLETAGDMIRQGANVLVTGSAFYRAEDPGAFVEGIRRVGRRG